MAKTIKGKLTLNVTFFSVVIILLLSALILSVSGSKIISCSKNELMLESEKYAEQINTWLQEEKMIVENVAKDIEIQKNTSDDFLSDLVHGYVSGRTELQNLYVGTAKSVLIKTLEGDMSEGYDPVQRGWYQQAAKTGDTIMTDPYIDDITGQMCVSFASPVYIDGKLSAVAASDVSLEMVSQIVQQIDYTKGAYGFLTDSAGNYIVHKNSGFMPSGSSTTVFTDIVPELKDSEGKVVLAKDYNGSENYFALTKLRGGDWKLGVTVPWFNVISSLFAVIIISFIIQIAAILIIVFVIGKITGRLLAPIQTLKLFASGDFSNNASVSSEIPEEYRDETEQITVATAKVRQQIREIILEAKKEAKSISLISSKISEVVTGVQEQTGRADLVAEKINVSGQEIGKEVDGISKKAANLAEQSNSIMKRAEKLYCASQKSSRKTAALYEEAKQKLEEAIEDSKKISDICGFAEDIILISSQTNILAMNASVAAARAGKAGKEFSVLAGEIRMLANHSGNIADNITNVMNIITDSVKKLASQSNSLLSFVSKDVMADYEKMISMSKQYENDASFVCKMSAEMETSSIEMNTGIIDINRSINEISELVSDISGGMKVIEENTEKSDRHSKSQSLSELSVSLNKTVSAFKV